MKKKRRGGKTPRPTADVPAATAPGTMPAEPLDVPDDTIADELEAALAAYGEGSTGEQTPDAPGPMLDSAKEEEEEEEEEQDAIFAATITRGVEYAFGAAARVVEQLELRKREQAFALQLRVEEVERNAPPEPTILAACIVASALDAHRETIQSLGLMPRGPLSRADRDHAAEVGEVLNVTQNALSQQNEARNRAVADLQRIAKALDGPVDPATIDDVRMSLRDVLGYLARAGAPRLEAGNG